jgi:signal transduction histidine kinase
VTNILRNAARVLRAVFVFRFFIFAFGVVVFAIQWSVQGPLEAFDASARFGSPLLGLTAVTVLFLFIPGLEERLGRLYLPIALFLTILVFGLESGVSYLQPGSHFLIRLPSGQVLSLFWASTEIILMMLIPCVLAGAAYGVRGALMAATLATGLHVLSGVGVWLSGIPLRGFLALFPLRVGVLYVFPLIGGYLADTWRREHEALEKANRQLRGYAATVEHLATSRERVRLARDMHDTLAHSLSAVVVQLEAVEALQETNPVAAREQLVKVQRQARSGLGEARRAIQNLRSAPVEELGLAEAIEQLVRRFGHRNGVAVDWRLEGEPAPLLPVQANALYRIVEEALSNVERHAEARQVTVRLGYQHGVTLTVRDDGRGFDLGAVDADRYGLLGIHERAALIGADVTVDSAPNEGTTLRVQIAEPWKD